MATTQQTLLSDRELARLLGVSRASVWRWTARKLLPAPVTIGERTRRWRQADIERFLSEREASA